ncbi:hypothetical protein M9H77_21238 [Catharanthus roseus]|uniref:Uncharacterized protein n=1 Tax=Catharanthus roseus TaxID=4058 RepID=A0ACC0AM13_CATRO|nr:hypothetical protein M9H77_21238 [Catharanthus roseus]
MTREKYENVEIFQVPVIRSIEQKIEEENNEMVVLLGKNFQGCTLECIGKRRCRPKRYQNTSKGHDAQERTKRKNIQWPCKLCQFFGERKGASCGERGFESIGSLRPPVAEGIVLFFTGRALWVSPLPRTVRPNSLRSFCSDGWRPFRDLKDLEYFWLLVGVLFTVFFFKLKTQAWLESKRPPVSVSWRFLLSVTNTASILINSVLWLFSVIFRCFCALDFCFCFG